MQKQSGITERLKGEIKKRKQVGRSVRERLIFEELLSSISASFINLPADRVDAEIQHAMRAVMNYFKVDHFGLVEVLPNKKSWIVTHCVSSAGVPSIPVGMEHPSSNRQWAYDKLIIKREVVSFSKIDDLPAEANEDKEKYMAWGIRSTLNVPVLMEGPVVHVIVINSVKREREWPEEFVPRLQLLGAMFVNVLERRKNRLESEEQLRFEMLLAEISGRFVNLTDDQLDREIRDAQRRICECLGLDLSALWQWSMETPRILKLTHLYGLLEGPSLPEPMYAHEYFPWCQQQMEAGRIVAVSSMEDLPAEAARDQEVWRHFGVKTTLTFPLSTEVGPPIGALSFNSTQKERTWPESLIKRLQLVAQVFINALIRKQIEKALRESEERLNLTTCAVGAGLWIRM